MDSAQVEFLAQKEIITIVPNFSHGKIFLISGDVGPFVAGLPSRVPLWMAVNMRRRQKCRILPPEWMDVDQLEEVKEQESQSKFFTKMPNDHYMTVAQLVLDTAIQDIPRADQIRTILKDIWDIRMAKLRTSVDAFVKSGESHGKLDHLTLLEMNTMRPLLPHTLDQLLRLRQTATVGPSQTQD